MLLEVQMANRARGNYAVIKSLILVRCESSVQGRRLEIYARSVHGQVDFTIRDGIKSIANKVKQLRNKEARGLYEYLGKYKNFLQGELKFNKVKINFKWKAWNVITFLLNKIITLAQLNTTWLQICITSKLNLKFKLVIFIVEV